MRVLFVQDNALDESLALLELAAVLEARGHTVELLLDREEPDLVASARAVSPDVVLVACSVLNHGWARGVAHRLRPLGRPLVVGGTAPTLHPPLLRGSDFDWLIRGEAETPLLGLLDGNPAQAPGLFRYEGADLVGTAATPGWAMAEVPSTRRELYYKRYPFMARFPFKRFLASRGCHHKCSYCYIPGLARVQPKEPGRRWVRRKSPEAAVDEVVRARAAGPLSHVHFSDDLFTDDPAWLEAFAPEYRRRVGIPFTCNTSAELVDDRVAIALGEAGCYAAGFAVETGNGEVRRRLLRKGVTADHFARAAGALRRRGVKVSTFNMIALPGETPDEALDTARLNAEIGVDYVRLNYAFPMPGTGIAEYAAEQRLLPDGWLDRFEREGFNYVPGPQFATPFRREFENLFVLFRLAAASPRLLPAVRAVLPTRTPGAVRRLLTLQGAWNEKRTFRIPVFAGMRYFARVGRPELRATNFPSLI